jgi:PAS domain S-box-containing protein
MKTYSILILLVSSIVLTGISAAITHFAVRDSRDRVEWVFHTYQAIGQSSELLALLKDMESSQRGYILTGNTDYLKNIESNSRILMITEDSLLHLVSDNPQQTLLLTSKLFPIIQQKHDLIRDAIRYYSIYGQDSASNFVKRGKGKTLMDSIQVLKSAFSGHEKVLLTDRLQQVMLTNKRQSIVRYSSFTLIALVSLLALITIVQKDRKNKELIGQLNTANEVLEQKVKQRTLELQQQSDLTEQLNEELQQNMEELETFYETLQVRHIKTEDALQEVQDLYNNAPCGYHSLSPEGVIIRMNQTELKWLGYTKEEVLGSMQITNILIPEEHQSYYDDFASFKKTGVIHNKEHTFLRKDGSTFPVLLNATAIYNEDGTYLMSRGNVTDITERKEYERQLMDANKKLVHFNEEKNNFLSIAAHDLKSPINNIIGLISLIKMQKGNDLSSDQSEYIHYIQQACNNMQNLIINLLDINKIEQGINDVNPEKVNMSNLVKHHLHVFKESAAAKNIQLTLKDHSPDINLVIDVSAMQRILENLLSNALKFSPKNKEVIIRILQHEDVVKIEVEDGGPGIPPEEIGMLFKKFKKLSARPTDGESSTGLGLSIVKELVHLLKGKVYVESEVNKRTVFTIELPFENISYS